MRFWPAGALVLLVQATTALKRGTTCGYQTTPGIIGRRPPRCASALNLHAPEIGRLTKIRSMATAPEETPAQGVSLPES